MVYTIALKRCRLSDFAFKYIEEHVVKLAQFLSDFDPDLLLLNLVIRKHKKRRLNHISESVLDRGETQIGTANPKAEAPLYYDGTIVLVLPKKPLIVHFLGQTLSEAVSIGFERLFKELDTYKGKHFPNDSEYFDHRSVRTKEV